MSCLSLRGCWSLGMVLAGLLAAVDLQAAGTVKLTQVENAIQVTIDGAEFTTYHTAADQPKPYFSPVKAADGAIITRAVGTGEDHPHHKGIWTAVDEVNEVDFWAEKGKIANTKVELVTAEGNPAVMKVTNEWQGADGKPVVTEHTTIAIYANRLLDYTITLQAGAVPVHFGDTKEGLFGIRLANTVREKEGGKVENAEGMHGTAECWGKESAWVDYYGTVDGKVYGATIMVNPKNPKPSRFHVRDYGLFTVSPFGTSAYTNGKEPADELTIPADGKFTMQYGLYIHDGDTATGKVADAYADYLKHEHK